MSAYSSMIQAIGNGSPFEVVRERVMRAVGDGRNPGVLNRTAHGLTPLMALAEKGRQDDDETIRIAKLLVSNGADVNEREPRFGVSPLFQCCQKGYPNLLQFLIDEGAEIDTAPLTSATHGIFVACVLKDIKCVVIMARAAHTQGKLLILESRAKANCTVAYMAVQLSLPEILGVLAMAGSDLRKACPYQFVEEGRYESPDPSSNAFSLNKTVRSFCYNECNNCGVTPTALASDKKKDIYAIHLQTCARCRMAKYCSVKCQKKDFPSHKKVCKPLRAGQDLLFPENNNVPAPDPSVYGFAEHFTEVDNETLWEYYDRDIHPVWEYNAGGGGPADWRRYPPRIEEDLELSYQSNDHGNAVFRPGTDADEGFVEERLLSLLPPSNASTRCVYFYDMIERDLYTGSSRSVRRNGKRYIPILSGSHS